MFPIQQPAQGGYDGFQQQLNDLQKRYAQMTQPVPSPAGRQPTKFRRVASLEEAKQIARDELMPGDEVAVFLEESNVFYALSKREDGVANPVLICPFTIEQEPPPPVYMTKQDFEQFKEELLAEIRKGETA